MPFLKLGTKKSAKDDTTIPKLTQFQAESSGSAFKEVWWVFVLLVIIVIAMLAIVNWGKIEPFIPVP